MNIDELLKQVNRSRTKQAEGEAVSQIPQGLQADPATELPKNVVAEGQAGDEQKVMDLLTAIEQGGETSKGASESVMTAKIAEEMAALDQVIIEKQAEHFGVKMADAFAQRLVEINNPLISEKQASDMAKAAAEEEYARWFNAGTALYDGYLAKAAEFGTDGGAGIIDNGGQPVPAAVNQSEVDAFADDLAGYLSSEFVAGDDGKSASEKQAGLADLAKKVRMFFARPPTRPVVDGAGKAIGNLAVGSGGAGYRAGNAAYNAIKNHPYMSGAIAAGVGAAGYAGHRYGPAAYNSIMGNRDNGNKQSSDAGAIVNAFTRGVISKKQAAEKLLALN